MCVSASTEFAVLRQMMASPSISMEFHYRRSWVSVRLLTGIRALTTASHVWLRRALLYDVELVRDLCRHIRAESDPEKMLDLVSLLNAVLRDAQEEIRMRIGFLARKYAFVLNDSKTVD